jgi:hypothetical protein
LFYDVTDSGHSENQFGFIGFFFQFGPDTANPCPEVLNIVAVFRPPYSGKEFFVKYNAAGVLSEFTQ